jgi:hypothetical protein
VTKPPPRWKSKNSGWRDTSIVIAVGALAVIAPLVAIIGAISGWGIVVLLVPIVLTVIIWAGFAVLLGPVYRRVNRQQIAQRANEIGKLPALAAEYGLTYAETDDELPHTLARHAATSATCTYVLSGRIGGQSMAVCWYDTGELKHLVLAMLLPAAMPTLDVTATMATTVAPGIHRERVQFEDDAFDNRYTVIPADHSPESAKYAVDLISQPAIDWLLSVEPFSFSIKGELLWVEGSPDLAADEVQRLLDEAKVLAHLVSGVPDFVWREYGSPPNTVHSLT